MELSEYVRLLRRRWVVIMLVLVACLAGAAAATAVQPKTYKASTELLVTVSDTGEIGELGSATYFLPDRVESFTSIVATPPGVAAAVDAADLPPGRGVSVAAGTFPDSAVLTIDVVASSPSDAQAVANAYVTVLPDVLASLNQVSSPRELTFKTLREAQLPAAPFQPDPLVNGAIGLAAGLVLGLAAAATREAFDKRIRDSRGIEEDTGKTLLGVVPLELRKAPLPAKSHPQSRRTEAYRTIRTNLLFTGDGGMVRSLAITSPAAGAGKSALASNLAIVCSRAGQRVALVEADLRRPSLHKQFKVTSDVGLSSVLNGSAALDDALHDVGDRITLLPSGPVPRNPSELLGNPLFRQIIEKLEGSHDVVIVDTAPTLPVADGIQVAAQCEGVIVVGRLRATTLASLQRTVDTLARSRVNVLGVVVTGNDEDPDAGYGYAYAAPNTGRRQARSSRGALRGQR